MKTDIATVVVTARVATPIKAKRTDLCSLPVANIRNISLPPPGDDQHRRPVATCPQPLNPHVESAIPGECEHEQFFDALADQPWMVPAQRQWPSLTSLASQVRDAIHYQLHIFSQTSFAYGLLNVIHPDLSKLLAAVLICSGRGKEIVCQASLMAGLQLINKLIYIAAGATSTAAVLSCLPELLLVWLQGHQVSLPESLLKTLYALLSSGLAICAYHDIAQPALLIELHAGVIAPLMQLCSETGISDIVVSGVTLILGIYCMLRLVGGLELTLPPANIFTHGIRIIEGLYRLSATSQDFQRKYERQQQQEQLKKWYQQTYRKEFDEDKASKALDRAVIRCLPKEVLINRAKRQATDNPDSSDFYRACQRMAQQILSGQLAICPTGGRSVVPGMPANSAAAAAENAGSAQASSSSDGASTPFLLPVAVLAGAAVPHHWWHSRTHIALAATGLTLIAGAMYMRHNLPRALKPSASELNLLQTTSNICLSATNNIRQLIQSNKTGVSLAVELFDKLFDYNGNVNSTLAKKLLEKENITSFKITNRNEMNTYLLTILSLLFTPGDQRDLINTSSIIAALKRKANKLWQPLIKNKKNKTVSEILDLLRLHCAKKYADLGIYSQSDMQKISDFLLSFVVTDLLMLERNGKGGDNFCSKESYYLLLYIVKKFIDNQYVSNMEFSTALTEGRAEAFVGARLISYAGYNFTSERAYLEEVYKDYNERMHYYHQQDTKLEALQSVTFDDIIQNAYPDIDIHAPQDFDTLLFRIKTQGRIDKEIRIIAGCKSFGEIIRNMEDGFAELYHYLPRKTPEELRYYVPGNQKTFDLKKHPKRQELYQQFDQAYEEMVNEHCNLYRDIVDNAFNIMAEDEALFLNQTDTQIYAIDVKVKRFKTLRNMFMPSLLRTKPSVSKHLSYHNRPYHEIGKIFFGYNIKTKEKRFYIINIESSRVHFRQFPVRRLPIDEKEYIYHLDNSILNENYIFMDERPFFDPCDDIKDPSTKLNRWDRVDDFIVEHYHYYKNKICAAARHPEEISLSYRERRLGDKDISPLNALKEEVVANRRKLLNHMKEKHHKPSSVEKEAAKGKAKQLIEWLPYYSCYEFLRDYLISREDDTPPSVAIPLFRAAICAADFYGGYGVKKTLNSLLNALKKSYTTRWVKKSELTLLDKKITESLTQPSSSGYADRLAAEIEQVKNKLEKLDDEIAQLRSEIHLSMGNIASIPVFVAFPVLSLKPGGNLLSASITWGINIVKKELKKAYIRTKESMESVPWGNPQLALLTDNQSYSQLSPKHNNSMCYSGEHPTDNIVFDIFDLRRTNTTLYQQLFFTALRDPSPEVVIASAENAGWIIAGNYNQVTMFSFISMTVAVRFYIDTVLAQQDYYKNDIDLSEDKIIDYLSDYITPPCDPCINPPFIMQEDQNILVNQSIQTIKTVLESNIQGIELNYLFMIQYFLMKEDIASLLWDMNENPEDRQYYLDLIQQHLSYEMKSFTLYGAYRSAAQQKFHATVINQFCHYCKQITDSNPANITLFSPNIDTFLSRAEYYQQLYPAAILPSPADFTHNWLLLAKNISDIYQSFARIEYSAKALADFRVEQWDAKAALAAWLAALQSYLFPEMRYENIAPVLTHAAKKLRQSWQQRQSTTGDSMAIVTQGVVNPLFIDDVKTALESGCTRHSGMFFCQIYLLEHGDWFTFLANDFTSDVQQRPKRQPHGASSSWPLTPLDSPTLEESVILPVSYPTLHLNNRRLYQQQLNMLQNAFRRDAALPFHQRLQSDVLDVRPLTQRTVQRDAMVLINSVIDAQGDIVDYQQRLLSHYLPQVNTPDNYPILKLLSDILQMTTPAAPTLYPFILHHLQNKLAAPSFTLSMLWQQSFIDEQVAHIYRQFSARLTNIDADATQALRRYITATLRHLLSFSIYLRHIEPLLAEAPLQDLASQWLSLGAIIALQLKVKAASAEELLTLSWAAQHDAGLLSLQDTAIQQTALLCGCRASDQREVSQDALRTMAPHMKTAAEMHKRILACLDANQLLALFITHLAFDALSPAQESQLHTLVENALQNQRDLLHIALQQLSLDDKLRLSQFLQQGTLQARWYLVQPDPAQTAKVAGLAFARDNQRGLLLPLADPQYLPLIFRQLPQSPTDSELTLLCFGIKETPHNFTEPTRLTLTTDPQAGGAPITDPAASLFRWLQSAIETQLNLLNRARDEITFSARKAALGHWLSQHLFFFDQQQQDDYQFIQQQTERMTQIATHPELDSWMQQKQSQPGNLTTVTHFNQAITRVLGASTIWPTLTMQLRALIPAQGATTLASLPENGFCGFWWDPISGFCYLGWITGEKRTLFASLAANRDILYQLPDDAASATIWPVLTLFDWLQQSVQALRNATLSSAHFFDYAIPLAWQLQQAMSAARPLPADAVRHNALADVYITGDGGSYFNPGVPQQVIPVTLADLPDGGYRIDFSASSHQVSPDQAFSLDTHQVALAQEGKWIAMPQPGWQLISALAASTLIEQGIFSPVAYLQWGEDASKISTMAPAAQVLQRSDGSMVFIFSENNFQRISYRMLDADGRLQFSPTLPSHWPQESTATNEQQFNATLITLLAQQNSSDYRALFDADERQRLVTQLSASQSNRQTAITDASGIMSAIPFRCSENQEALHELFDIRLHLRTLGRDLDREIKASLALQEVSTSLSALLSRPFDWRGFNLYDTSERQQALILVRAKIALLKKLLNQLESEIVLQTMSDALRPWIKQNLNLTAQVEAAIRFIQQQPPHQLSVSDPEGLLQRQCFAEDYLFSYYELQLHVTADIFQHAWPCIRVSGGSTAARHGWQAALDQLHTLTSALPQDYRLLNRLLYLSGAQWRAVEMSQRAEQWREICHAATCYWQTPHQAEQITLLRPKLSAQDFPLIPQHYHWPVRLILSAGKGDPMSSQAEGIAPAWQLSAEQQEDLLLTMPQPADQQEAATRLAGINAHPRTAQAFVAWAKLRLSSAWALAEFSGPAFLTRLQLSIQRVIQQESASWSQEEDDFYRAADTTAFLQESATERLNKPGNAQFFRQLFNSDLLVTRLIMTDVEMLFALLCDRFIEQYPARATEDVSQAWFLFLHTADSAAEGNNQQSIYLVGV
ncbi:hypothetical protein N5923_04560 [Erwiniaceae bacterium BAC15a-03b]|uniref:Uncharacterized protein n=1 Tax=Winslowiella arboricola TaxID=2978220 RepID=A0A9J6PM18_9GAMM|nr:hypothetical protein [Winslowiella arboricola]MCU5773448.1 hypothetical protein [Winslowiella arboricola]MCU5776773.1 hypothetical protein [Winslowiella arboricola]